MKMNRFRVNLHPAFFEGEIEAMSTAPEQKEFFTELETLAQEIGNEEFKRASFKFLEDVNQNKERRITSRYDLLSQDPKVREKENKRFKDDHQEFSKRLKDNQNDWDSKIIEGFGRLIHALQDEGYFDEIKNIKDNDEKKKKMRKKIDKVKGKYWNEVRKLYINNVWPNSKDPEDDNKFNYVKDKLFDEKHLEYYPANTVYCKELPGTGSIVNSGSTTVEGYGIQDMSGENYFNFDDAETTQFNEGYLSRDEINFISNDLPEYLRNIKGKSVGNINLGVYSESEYRTSKEDRKAIKKLLKVASKLKDKNGNEKIQGDKVIALLNVFKEVPGESAHNTTYKNLLAKHGLSVDDSDLRSIIKLGNFYRSTQKSEVTRNQHAIFLDILKILEDVGGPKNLNNYDRGKFKTDVRRELELRKQDRKDGVTGADKLHEAVGDEDNYEDIAEFTSNFGITNLESVARLVDKSKNAGLMNKPEVPATDAEETPEVTQNLEAQVEAKRKGIPTASIALKDLGNWTEDDFEFEDNVKLDGDGDKIKVGGTEYKDCQFVENGTVASNGYYYDSYYFQIGEFNDKELTGKGTEIYRSGSRIDGVFEKDELKDGIVHIEGVDGIKDGDYLVEMDKEDNLVIKNSSNSEYIGKAIIIESGDTAQREIYELETEVGEIVNDQPEKVDESLEDPFKDVTLKEGKITKSAWTAESEAKDLIDGVDGNYSAEFVDAKGNPIDTGLNWNQDGTVYIKLTQGGKSKVIEIETTVTTAENSGEKTMTLTLKSSHAETTAQDQQGEETKELTTEQAYFINTPIEIILANLDNDDKMSAGDFVRGGQKSGQQFLAEFNRLSKGNPEKKQELLNNLYDRAILEINALGYGETFGQFATNDPGSRERIEKAIRRGDVKVILLLQNIISKPGEDFNTLLLGHKEGESMLDSYLTPERKMSLEQEMRDKEEAKNRATENVNNLYGAFEAYKSACKEKGIQVTNSADVQSAIASCLYDTYKFGLGAGGTISFHDWLQGVSIGYGAQVGKKRAVLGLNISFDPQFYTNSGWILSPGISAGLCVPVLSGKKGKFASVGLKFTAEKVIPEVGTGRVDHQGFGAGVELLSGIVYAGWHHNRDLAEGLEADEITLRNKFEDQVMKPIIEEIAKKYNDGQRMDIENAGQRDTIIAIIQNKIKEIRGNEKLELSKDLKELSDDDLNRMTGAMVRLLSVYNNANLTDPVQQYVIEKNIADQYLNACVEQRKLDLIDEGRYYSGYSIFAFWKVGTPLAGVGGTREYTKHEYDARSDHSWTRYEQEEGWLGTWNDNELKIRINDPLGLDEDEKLTIVPNDNPNYQGLIKIPASTASEVGRVKVTEGMKGLMIKDKEGNVYIHAETPMKIMTETGSAVKGGKIIIGGGREETGIDLSSVDNNSYVDKIDESRITALRETIEVCTTRTIDSVLTRIKEDIPDFNLETVAPGDKSKRANEINECFKKGHSAIFNFELESGGKANITISEGAQTRKCIEIKCNDNKELINEAANNIAKRFYNVALNLEDPSVLHSVKKTNRQSGWREWGIFETSYDTFINNPKPENEQPVRDILKEIFTKVDKRANTEEQKFLPILNSPEFDNLHGNDLVQALMSIKNIFARSSDVIGNGTEYEFKGQNMSDIIKRRYRILNTLKENKNIDSTTKNWYEELFNAVKTIVDNPANSAEFGNTATTINTYNQVGFNLGDFKNPENPLLNPQELNTPSANIDKLMEAGLSKEARNGLHRRLMGKFAENDAMINPLLETLGVPPTGNYKEALKAAITRGEENKGMSVTELEADQAKNKIYVDENGKCHIELDINGKKLIITAGMQFGFYTQCVNHTIILDDITGVYGDKFVTYQKGASLDGTDTEGRGGTDLATRKREFGFTVALGQESSGGANGDANTDLNNDKLGPVNGGGGDENPDLKTDGDMM